MGSKNSTLEYKDDLVLLRTLKAQFEGYAKRTGDITSTSDELVLRLGNSLREQCTRVMDDNYKVLQKRLKLVQKLTENEGSVDLGIIVKEVQFYLINFGLTKDQVYNIEQVNGLLEGCLETFVTNELAKSHGDILQVIRSEASQDTQTSVAKKVYDEGRKGSGTGSALQVYLDRSQEMGIAMVEQMCKVVKSRNNTV
ncbi:uncharacterized protein LOC142343928 [Convolutriloba macropyga]|uniref:uncharacterized protein LOC142343928 n=1 Tax=Convolutriloba macropyga TaxID=536237 RepID=UPI003F51D1B2